MSNVEKWGQNPEREAKLYELSSKQVERERAKEVAREALDLLTPEVVKIVREIMKDENQDINARLRAAEILMSRQLPKVAAQHIDAIIEHQDSTDIEALRDDILKEVNKKRGTDG